MLEDNCISYAGVEKNKWLTRSVQNHPCGLQAEIFTASLCQFVGADAVIPEVVFGSMGAAALELHLDGILP